MDEINDEAIIREALNKFLDEDHYLLENDTSERSMTHRIGLHLQNTITRLEPECKLHVDCEWDRNIDSIKVVDAAIFLKKVIHSEAKKAAAIVEEIKAPGFDEKALAVIRTKIGETCRSITASSNGEESARAELEHMRSDYASIWGKLRLTDGYFSNAESFAETEEMIKGIETRLDTKRWGKTGFMPIIPDIICHERGKCSNNRFVIEAKKSLNGCSEERRMDYIKLACMLTDSSFAYKNGYALDIPVGKDYGDNKETASLRFPKSDYGIIKEIDGIFDIVYATDDYPYLRHLES